MVGKEKKNTPKQPRPRRRFGWRIGLALVTLLALGAGAMHANSRIVHVRYADVKLEDLPAAFEGTTILFASDFDICGANTAEDIERLFDKLQALHPDLLLLGGDYASATLVERLNGRTSREEDKARQAFFAAIADFHAPLGKLAVSGDNDGDANSLNMAMMNSGVELIDGALRVVTKGNDAIGIAGVGENAGNLNDIAGKVRTDQCVIALLHRPARIVDVQIAEARDGGQWADLALAGHTHGGQLRVAGRSMLSLDETEKRCIGGWYSEGAPLLVSQGVGCEGVNLRFGSQAEVWMITLKRK